jgi:Chorismate synthase
MFECANCTYLDAVLTNRKWKLQQDYSEMAKAYRPSHADATYDFKYGIRAVQVPFVFSFSFYLSTGANVNMISLMICYLINREEADHQQGKQLVEWQLELLPRKSSNSLELRLFSLPSFPTHMR